MKSCSCRAWHGFFSQPKVQEAYIIFDEKQHPKNIWFCGCSNHPWLLFLGTLKFKKFKQNGNRILIRKAAGIYLLVILPSVVCLLIRLLPFSLKFMFLSFSALLLCLLISSKSDASRYSSSWMISNARPYLRMSKSELFYEELEKEAKLFDLVPNCAVHVLLSRFYQILSRFFPNFI